MAHRRNVYLFHRYYFDRCSSELAQLVPLPFSPRRSTRYSDRLHDFSVTIPRCYKDVYVNSFFPRRVKLWNSLPVECFLLIFLMILTVLSPELTDCRFFLNSLSVSCNLFCASSLVTPWLFSLAWSESHFLKKTH